MQHAEQNRIYYRNLLFSFFLSIGLIASALSVLFIVLFFIKIIIVPPQEQPAEKRYAIELQKKKQPEKQIPKSADNINENKKRSDLAKFLSTQDSESAAPTLSDKKTGDVAAKPEDYTNLELKSGERSIDKEASDKRQLLSKSYSTESIFGEKEKGKKSDEGGNLGQSRINQLSTESRKSGAERISASISLSTYEWSFMPYITMMKQRMYKFVSPPPAYFLGLLKGKSRVKLVINRDGELLEFQMLDHYGSKPLQTTTEDLMVAIFKLPPLPPDFPDKTLTMVWVVNY